jgi:Protein of unknown function (DUF1549)/Protein of unknown function (DUF1553)
MRLHRASIAWLVIAGCLMCDSLALAGAPSPDVASAVVLPDAQSSERMAGRTDALLGEMWRAEQIEPAPPACDGEFLRRAFLDLNGVIPRVGDVRAFLADDHPDKRALLIDRLLASPRYSTHMATIWRNRILPLGVDASRGPQAVALQKWLRTRFARNLRYDNLVGEMLLTLGGDELGPALYYQANDVSPEKLATSTAELFLGIHLQCAQCHDHPTAGWKQRDFWGLAAFFARVQAPEERGNMMRMSYRLVDAEQGDVRLPNSGEIVSPKFPGGGVATDEARRSRRRQLALWLTSRENEFFARAAVNWAWSQLFGRGLVESLDDAPTADSNNQLLNELAAYFVESGYDLRNLWRTLATTRAYQLSSRGGEPEAPPRHFSRMLAKPLTPEQLYDSFALLAPLDVPLPRPDVAESNGVDKGLQEDPARMDFIRRMRPPPGDSTEYRAGTLQALLLMNGRATSEITSSDRSNILGALEAPFMSDEDRVQALFLATLARAPNDDESRAGLAALAKSIGPEERSRTLSDILWALLNSTEFAFNQ